MDERTCAPDDAPELDLRAVAAGLQAAGWDVIVDRGGAELAARLDPAPQGGVWSLVVDRSGRWRWTMVCDLAAPAGRAVQIGQRRYALLCTAQRSLTTAGRMHAVDDLATVLGDLKALALAEQT